MLEDDGISETAANYSGLVHMLKSLYTASRAVDRITVESADIATLLTHTFAESEHASNLSLQTTVELKTSRSIATFLRETNDLKSSQNNHQVGAFNRTTISTNRSSSHQ
ncbi:hypothetical protein CROQUDRAFT_96489 [Cronartium quercuum f. sp. fusiforme G11]|uniref:Uncharacterized protein n=1 Tax=Cronartium quercuum f. sp. fusiforme G11 TaxID=708437 RepID=A0A9P6T8R7_9BASI|nr:hypothetical protein CROQUDRAFT_96489 [Cronartium quercuum f. sp. fusiforme G11]